MFSNEFSDGTITSKGFIHQESFRLDFGLPVWRYAIADALIGKRVVMQPGSNTTLVTIGCLPLSDRLPIGRFALDPVWYRQFKHRVDTERGLDDIEDLFRPGFFHITLTEGKQVMVTLTDELSAQDDFEGVTQHIRSQQRVWLNNLAADAPDWIRQLALAASQYIVTRWQEGQEIGKTTIAGYPWFTDWAHDSMIALPGLTLALGHFDIAAEILQTFAGHISEGMISNRFPDQDSTPEYNTADVTLWFIHAVDQYTHYSGDGSLATEIYPVLVDIIDWHRRDTRFELRVDPEDGLLKAGEAGTQLTWMDAKVGGRVVTPRIGKCVEINALWYNALMVMTGLAQKTGHPDQAKDYQNSAHRVKKSFERFWNKANRCLFDVIDGPEGGIYIDGKRYDGSVRPNQLFAVSLPYSPLKEYQQKAVVNLCIMELLTSYGLRSLADSEPTYAHQYQGDLRQRLSSGHCMGLAHRPYYRCPLPRVSGCRQGAVFS